MRFANTKLLAVVLSFRYGSNRWQCCSSYLSMAQILRSVQIMASHEPALNDAKGSRAREYTCIKLAKSSQANTSGRVGVVVAMPAHN